MGSGEEVGHPINCHNYRYGTGRRPECWIRLHDSCESRGLQMSLKDGLKNRCTTSSTANQMRTNTIIISFRSHSWWWGSSTHILHLLLMTCAILFYHVFGSLSVVRRNCNHFLRRRARIERCTQSFWGFRFLQTWGLNPLPTLLITFVLHRIARMAHCPTKLSLPTQEFFLSDPNPLLSPFSQPLCPMQKSEDRSLHTTKLLWLGWKLLFSQTQMLAQRVLGEESCPRMICC
jgi:hypothetical protein